MRILVRAVEVWRRANPDGTIAEYLEEAARAYLYAIKEEHEAIIIRERRTGNGR